jgi:hypothetical protein
MNGNKPPVSVVIVAWLYVAVGAVGFLYHGWEAWTRRELRWDTLLVESVELIALASGIFILRGRNWARWLALAWMAFHVALSFPELRQLAVHTVFLALIAAALLNPPAARYFSGAGHRL